MKALVIGVDPSSRKLAGVAMPTDAEWHDLWVVKLPEKAGIEIRCLIAYRTARALVRRLIREHPDYGVYVFIEAPLVGRGGVRTTVVQSKVHGAAVAGFLAGGASHVREENASRVKKAVVGGGNASKDEIMKWCSTWHPSVHEEIDGDQDLADACMHANYGVKTMRKVK